MNSIAPTTSTLSPPIAPRAPESSNGSQPARASTPAPQASGKLATLKGPPRPRSWPESQVDKSTRRTSLPARSPTSNTSEPPVEAEALDTTASAETPGTSASGRKLTGSLQTVVPYVPPVTEGIAAVHSIGAGGLALLQPGALDAYKGTTATSGVTWAVAAIVSEVDNWLGKGPHSKGLSAANLLSFGAGVLSAVSPFLPGSKSAYVGIASGASWLANTVVVGARAASLKDTLTRVMQGGNVVAGGVAAAFTVMAAKATEEGDSARAAIYTIVSGAFWALSAVAGGTAVRRGEQLASQTEESMEMHGSPV